MQLLRHVHFARSFTVQSILKIRQIHKSPMWSQLKFIKCKSSDKQFVGTYMTFIETKWFTEHSPFKTGTF